MRPSEQEAERLEGAIRGHLVGDAVGVPFELRAPDRVGDVVFGARVVRRVTVERPVQEAFVRSWAARKGVS
jgi:ADP-ribosylglycohydrolase